MSFLDLPDRFWLMDGAMGTQLLPFGLPCVAQANLTHPRQVRAIHAAYARAGAVVHLTNTFQVNPVALAACGLENQLEEMAHAAIGLARQAVGGGIVLGDVGPIMVGGKEDFSDREMLMHTLKALDGVDGLLFETCSTPSVLSAVEFALHRLGWLEARPLLLSIAYKRMANGEIRAWSGHPPEFFAHHAGRHGVSALGVNCGVGMRMEDIREVLGRYREATDLPLFARPNGSSPDEFARALVQWRAAGAIMVGGCCGTTADHIAAMR